MPVTKTPPLIAEKLASLPARSGVYLMKDAAGQVLYVGKAASLRARVPSYFQEDPGHPRTRALVQRTTDLDWIVVDSELEAVMLECNLIKRHRPRYNVRLRDDKRYPYIKIAVTDRFPRLMVVRNVERDGARYFGPYASTQAMWEAVRLVQRVFGVRQAMKARHYNRSACTWKNEDKPLPRPCLLYHLKLCTAPCVGKIAEGEYRADVEGAIRFLEGRHSEILDAVRAQMQQASDAQRFEQAAALRDKIAALEQATEAQKMVTTSDEDADVVGLALRADLGLVTVFQVREGKLVGQDYFPIEGVSGLPAGEVLSAFLRQHYEDAPTTPRSILLAEPATEQDNLAQWLSAKTGATVKLAVPQRGQKRSLAALATENAATQLTRLLERELVTKRRAEAGLAEIQEALGLDLPPQRIECFDISTFHGDEAVGSMVVFVAGLPKSSDYRRFKVRLEPGHSDDYAMMREVLTRRLRAAQTPGGRLATLPDLLIVDGGLGQLQVAVAALEELGLNIPVAALAKQFELLYRPGRAEPVALRTHSQGLHVLQRLRDEAHRFAVAYHRLLRNREMRTSLLDTVPGIGAVRRRALLERFRSVAAITAATVNDIAQVPGMTRAAAQVLLDHLRTAEAARLAGARSP